MKPCTCYILDMCSKRFLISVHIYYRDFDLLKAIPKFMLGAKYGISQVQNTSRDAKSNDRYCTWYSLEMHLND